jgi:Ca2+-binding RTX toxin-like protein
MCGSIRLTARRSRWLLALAIAVAIFHQAPAPATASSIALLDGTLTYAAEPGEANRLTITRVAGFIEFADAGTPESPAVVHVQTCGGTNTATTASCPDATVVRIRVEVADLNDVVTIADSVASPTPPSSGVPGITVIGGPNSDELNGGLASETLAGGSGDDTLRAGGGNDLLDFDDAGTAENDAQGMDVLNGGPGDDVLDGDDVTTAGSGDTFLGGDGTDTADFSRRQSGLSISLDGVANDGQGAETNNVTAEVERVVGGSGNDVISGSSAANVLEGRAGDDRLTGLGGDDGLIGSDGEENADGGDGNDVIAGDAGEDDLAGGDGLDTIDGGAGSDTLQGQSGDDDLAGGAGGDTIRGGDGNDQLDGAATEVAGADAADDLDGGAGADTLHGADGGDKLDGGLGPDRIYGDAGEDTVSYAHRTSPVAVTLNDLPDDGQVGELDNVASDVEIVVGGQEWNTIRGDAGMNTLSGGRNEDQLEGLAGRDRLIGGASPDLLKARDGEPDDVVCGDGGDLALVDAVDTVRDCEWLDRGGRRQLSVGRSALVQPSRGFDLRLPGGHRDYQLDETVKVPLGSRIGPDGGVIQLSTAKGRNKALQQASVRGDPFTLLQTKGARPVTVLRLTGGRVDACRASAARAPASSRRKKRETRVKTNRRKRGPIRVQGDYSDAVAEGTEWTTTDRCDGTLTRVISGTVSVTDRTRHKKIRVHAGDSHLARARR